MNEVSVEVQESREMMLALEQEEFDLGKRKRSHNYFCFRCGKMTHAKVGSDRRKAYLCAKCWKHRCSLCGKKGVIALNNVWYCKEHEIIPAMKILAPSMKPNETPLDTIDRLKDERIAELKELRKSVRRKEKDDA